MTQKAGVTSFWSAKPLHDIPDVECTSKSLRPFMMVKMSPDRLSFRVNKNIYSSKLDVHLVIVYSCLEVAGFGSEIDG